MSSLCQALPAEGKDWFVSAGRVFKRRKCCGMVGSREGSSEGGEQIGEESKVSVQGESRMAKRADTEE